MKSNINAIENLRLKLRMFGIPIDGPAYIYCDNESAVSNFSKTETNHCMRIVSASSVIIVV